MTEPIKFKTIHPFPARMASEIVWQELPDKPGLIILDPMAGSGTTLVAARLRGHTAIGFDSDPMAVLLSRAWLADVDDRKTTKKAAEVLLKAKAVARVMSAASAYPKTADKETRAFIRYWFDKENRVQLTALACIISKLRSGNIKNLLWCAFSRLIITKECGTSLTRDVSHSRPHRVYNKAPVRAFDAFWCAVQRVIRAIPFKTPTSIVSGSITQADARCLPMADQSVDVVITSPPYLNAIDYLRTHKFSLVWMGYNIAQLRCIRAFNVGTEACRGVINNSATDRILEEMCEGGRLDKHNARMVQRYIQDMQLVLHEINRVLRPGGAAVLVVGNCNIGGTFVQNSKCLEKIANGLGMLTCKVTRRPLPENRRYLPPPSACHSGKALAGRMREEVILTLTKE